MFLFRKNQALSADFCQEIIDTFENEPNKRPGTVYQAELGSVEDVSYKQSTDFTISPSQIEDKIWGPILEKLVPVLYEAISDYSIRFEQALSRVDPYDLDATFNIQRYLPNEGFREYHCERSGPGKGNNRILVWMVYLNNVTHRGETEFYFQNHFETPQVGNLLIWPSDWTYLHRGIPSPTQTKYIITGWISHPVIK